MEVPRDRLQLRDDESISPPYLEPLYRCSPVVQVRGFVPRARLDIEVDGAVVVAGFQAGLPLPDGAIVPLPAPLNAGQTVRARQTSGGATSAWSAPVTVRDHSADYPAGPPRPVISPAPVHKCGSRTGVRNLLLGSTVWITADGTEVGRVRGAKEHQGVNVAPDYGLGQRVVAWTEVCGDPGPPSAEEITQFLPPPLPAPSIADPAEGSLQLTLNGIANGARFRITRGGGVAVGTFASWGGLTYITLAAPVTAGEVFEAVQWLCPGDPTSPPGRGTGKPCSALGAPTVAPIQAGDNRITLLAFEPDATIKVFVNLVKAGEGGGPAVMLNRQVAGGDTVHVLQVVGACTSSLVQEARVRCVAPPIGPNPADLNLFPVGSFAYDAGRVAIGSHTHAVAGTVHYPAEADGAATPFNLRLAALGPVPIVVLVHGRHGGTTSHLGYDYFQTQLARMGMVAASVDCNESDLWGGWTNNILDRVEIVLRSIAHLQALAAGGAPPLGGGRVDFGRLGLMGHSRGGDAVVTLPERATLPGVQIRGVLSLAPVNSGASSGSPQGYPAFMTILPAHDGDVVDLNGAEFYDGARNPGFRCQLFVERANHNYFNRQWLNDDTGGGLPVMPREAHEAVLSAYGCAFFRHVLLNHATLGYLEGRLLPAGVDASGVQISFGQGNVFRRVDSFDDGNTIAQNSLGRPNTTAGGLAADEFAFSQAGGPRFNDSFFGATTGMVAQARETGGVFRTELDRPTRITGREVWLRAAEVYGMQSAPSAPTGFELGLETRAGAVTWVDSDGVGGLSLTQSRRAFDLSTSGVDKTKTMPKTLRFPVGCFGAARGEPVVAILIRLNRPRPRPIAFDDIEIV